MNKLIYKNGFNIILNKGFNTSLSLIMVPQIILYIFLKNMIILPFFMISLSILFGYMCLINGKNIFRFNQYSNEYFYLKKQVAEVGEEYAELSDISIKLNRKGFLEKRIKQQLGYVLPGEQVYYFVKKGYK